MVRNRCGRWCGVESRACAHLLAQRVTAIGYVSHACESKFSGSGRRELVILKGSVPTP